MKRLFFLFVFLFVGFGAFGQVDSLLRVLDSLSAHYGLPMHKNKTNTYDKNTEEWYIRPYSLNYPLGLGWNHMMIQDNLYTPFTYSGSGVDITILMRYTQKKHHWGGGLFIKPALLSSPNVNEEFIEDISHFSGIFLVNYAYRMGKSPHYVGLSGNYSRYGATNLFNPAFGDLYVGNESVSLGLFYLYHGKIKRVNFIFQVTLPFLAAYSGGVKRDFNPTSRIEIPLLHLNEGYTHLGIYYTFSYLNYFHHENFDYRHRQVINSIGLIFNFDSLDY